jgi:hypothetical protein
MTRCNEVDNRAADAAGVSRRTILTGAVTGFVVTASGLLLPGGEDEANAREGSYGGALGGRRGPNRRSRDPRKRRDKGKHSDKKGDARGNDSPAPGSGLFRNSALTVYTEGAARFTFTFYYRIKTGLDDYGPWTQASTATPIPGFGHRYAPDRFRIGVLISAPAEVGAVQAFVDVRNLAFAAPRGAAYVGSGLDPAHGKLGSALIAEQAFASPLAPSSAPDPVTRLYHVGENRPALLSLWRAFDSDGSIEFFGVAKL